MSHDEESSSSSSKANKRGLEACCGVPSGVEARIISIEKDRRAYARRSLKAGEVLLRNAPTAHVVWKEHKQCAFCLSVPSKLLKCGGCKNTWYCSRTCQKQDFKLHKVECKEASLLWGNNNTSHNASLLVRNYLSLRTNDETCKMVGGSNGHSCWCGAKHFDNLLRYEGVLDFQECLDVQIAATALWNQRVVVRKLLKNSTSYPSPSELKEQLMDDFRRFKINNFGVTDAMVRVVASAVYPLGALLNHSCAPNCLLRYTIGSVHESPIMEVVAARDIPSGEELTHSYVELVSSRASRRANLRSVYGFDCHCRSCSTLDPAKISFPSNHTSLSSLELARSILRDYNPASRKESPCIWIDPDLLLRPSQNEEIVGAAMEQQRQSQHCMRNGDLHGELAASKEAVRLFESALVMEDRPGMSLEVYKSRCDRLGSLIVVENPSEAMVECEHIVAFLCLALQQVPNHSLLGLQLFTLGDLYEANGNHESAQAIYQWARRILRISQGSDSEMVRMLNQKLQ